MHNLLTCQQNVHSGLLAPVYPSLALLASYEPPCHKFPHMLTQVHANQAIVESELTSTARAVGAAHALCAYMPYMPDMPYNVCRPVQPWQQALHMPFAPTCLRALRSSIACRGRDLEWVHMLHKGQRCATGPSRCAPSHPIAELDDVWGVNVYAGG
eukprot:1158084-Pelagomonas_calceolata.AAC.12